MEAKGLTFFPFVSKIDDEIGNNLNYETGSQGPDNKVHNVFHREALE